MNVKMLEKNDAAHEQKSTCNTLDNESMICEFLITLYYKLSEKKGSIFFSKLSHLWQPIRIQDVGASETQISYNNKLTLRRRYET